MDASITKHFNIPPASLPIIPVVFLIIIIPFYDRICVPLLRRFTGIPTGITHLQRIGVGLILSSVSMAIAAIIEVKRKRVARDNNMLDALPGKQPLPLSIFWLSFQFFVFGIADMFTYVGESEYHLHYHMATYQATYQATIVKHHHMATSFHFLSSSFQLILSSNLHLFNHVKCNLSSINTPSMYEFKHPIFEKYFIL